MLTLGSRLLLRDARAGELTLLFIALVLAVASLASVGFFTERLGRAITDEANQILGGDLVITADRPLPPAYREEAVSRGLQANETASFTSMASTASGTALVGVKAVEQGYPLRGALRVSPGRNRPDAETRTVPARGEAWVDERLASSLSLAPGDVLNLGAARLRVGAILTYEPDRGVNFFAIVPRVMIAAEDLPATSLIREGSRVTYRLHLAGDAQAVSRFGEWSRARLTRGQSLEDVATARPELRNALDRAQRFLKLAALLAVVLAAIAIGLSARRFMERHLDGCAVMRCMGASRAKLVGLFALEFLALGVLACAVGAGLGFAVQALLAQLIAQLMGVTLPAPGWLPLAQGVAVVLVLLAGFVAPHLARLARVSALSVMRREWRASPVGDALAWALGACALAALMWWIAADFMLGAAVVGGLAAALLIFALAAWLGLRLTGLLRAVPDAGVRFGLTSLNAKWALSVVQTVALALGVMALVVLAVTRADLLRNWKNSVPPDAPNRFVINIQPEQKPAVEAFLKGHGVASPILSPMVRGRLTDINGQSVQLERYPEERARRLLDREFNLSYSAEVPYGNKVVEGTWHGTRGEGFSVEQGLAQTLGLKLGDRLRFEVAGRAVESTITSVRALRWDSMRVNFFVITPPGALKNLPESYLSAFHAPADQPRLTEDLVAQFPNLTVIDVSAVLAQFARVMDQLSAAVECVFVFSILAGLIVMAAALAATHDERRHELAVLRTLGARNAMLNRALITEFFTLGLIAGALGAGGAAAVGAVLAQFVFKVPYEPDVWALLLASLACAGLVMAGGLLGTRGVLRAPVLASLRAGAQ